MGDGRGGEKSRAQLILVGAVALAVALASIALVLNASIYAENLATRANQDEPARISALQQEAATGTAEAMHHHHHDTVSHSNYSELKTQLAASLRTWSTLQVQDSAREGRFIDAEAKSMTDGTRVVQDDGSEFTPRDNGLLQDIIDITDVSSWAVTSQAYQVRDHTMVVERDGISDGTLYAEATVETFLLELGGSLSVGARPFTVLYDVNDDDTYEHAVSLYRPDDGDGDSNDVKFTYYNQSTDATTTCEVDNAPSTFDVDVSNSVVEGADGECADIFDFQSESDDPYQLVYANGEEIEGNYQFIMDTDKGDFASDYEDSGGLIDGILGCLISGCPYDFESYYDRHDDGHGDSPSHTSPYVEPAIYDTDVLVTYQSERVESSSTIRVAPDEP